MLTRLQSPLLPDHFRRSPKGKGRARQAESNPSQRHQPGSIVRVALSNFVTYTRAEFQCGPNLNMVIGPNGTGKSTLVCAICLGLGGATSLLGRAKDVNEFVKHGARRAEVEIELAADPTRSRSNPIVTMRISKEENKCSFYIDRRSSTRKAVQELARSFSIQIDNLCQFLPQDRVVEFAALSPVDLLTQTQRAAAPQHMAAWHEELKSKGKERKQKAADLQSAEEQLKTMEDRQRSQEAEVGRLRERSNLQERTELLEKLRPFPIYHQLTVKHKEAKRRKKDAQKELQALERSIAPSLEEANAKERYLEAITAALPQRQRVIERSQKTAEAKLKEYHDAQTKIDECEGKIRVERDSSKKAKQTIIDRQKDIRQIEQSLLQPPAPFDPAEYNEQCRLKRDRIRAIQNEQRSLREDAQNLRTQLEQRKKTIAQAEGEMQSLHSQAGRQLSKLENASRDTAKAWRWIQENRSKFTGEVYGPPMIECSVPNPHHTDIVEAIVGRGELLALTVTTREDFDMLTTQVFTTMGLNDVGIRSILQPLSSFQPPVSDDQLQSLKLQGWVRDMIEGPDGVLAMLCDQKFIERTAFSDHEMTNDEYEALKRSPINSWAANGQLNHMIRRREYGDQGVSHRTQFIKKARLLTDAPVDIQVEQNIKRRIGEAKSEIEEIKQQNDEVKQKLNALEAEGKQVQTEFDAINDEKRMKQAQQTQFDGLETKLSNAKDRLETAQRQVRECRDRQLEIVREGDKYCMEKCQHAIEYANLLDTIRKLQQELFVVELKKIEAQSDLDQLRARHQEETASLEAKAAEVQELIRIEQESLTRGKAVADECRAIAMTLSEEQGEVQQEVAQWDPDRLETEIQSIQAQLEMLQGGGGANVIKEYEQRAAKIEQRKSRVAELTTSMARLSAEIDEVRHKWEPELDGLIGQISDAFAENFSRMQCAGEVAVYKDEDFDKWAIQIKVKFR